MTPGELFHSGKLTEAVSAAVENVKKHPADVDRRGLLCELLCFVGEFERADKQLETIGQQQPESMLGIGMLRQLIRGEIARQEFFCEGRLPEFLGEVSPHMRLQLEASITLREGHASDAAELLAKAEAQRVQVGGTCDGNRFDDFRDLDDLTAPVFEVLTSTGKYYWVPMENVESIEFHTPGRPQDLLWRRAQMVVRGGPDGEVFLPTLYPQTYTNSDDQLRMGRSTEWIGGDASPVRGVGMRMFLIGDEDQSILQLEAIEFDSQEQDQQV